MVSTVKQEPGRISDWLLYEEDDIGRYSRDNVVVGQNQTLKCGSVVGYNEAGTEVVEYDDAAPDAAVAAGILVADVTTGADQTAGCAIVSRHARINPNALVGKRGWRRLRKQMHWLTWPPRALSWSRKPELRPHQLTNKETNHDD